MSFYPTFAALVRAKFCSYLRGIQGNVKLCMQTEALNEFYVYSLPLFNSCNIVLERRGQFSNLEVGLSKNLFFSHTVFFATELTIFYEKLFYHTESYWFQLDSRTILAVQVEILVGLLRKLGNLSISICLNFLNAYLTTTFISNIYLASQKFSTLCRCIHI